MSRYAENTEVAADRSRSEIEKTLRRYGADAFAYGWEEQRAVVQFKANGRYIKFELPMPAADEDEIVMTPTGRERSAAQQEKAYEQATRQRWRALSLVIKAKLEAVESGITTFEEEFLAHTVLPNGSTVGAYMIPQVEEAYATAKMPALLPAVTG